MVPFADASSRDARCLPTLGVVSPSSSIDGPRYTRKNETYWSLVKISRGRVKAGFGRRLKRGRGKRGQRREGRVQCRLSFAGVSRCAGLAVEKQENMENWPAPLRSRRVCRFLQIMSCVAIEVIIPFDMQHRPPPSRSLALFFPFPGPARPAASPFGT